jgi:hypothetical protein
MAIYMANIYGYASIYQYISDETFHHLCSYTSGEKEWLEELIKLEMYNQICEAKRQHNLYMLKIKEELVDEVTKWKMIHILNRLICQFTEINYEVIAINVCRIKVSRKKEFLIGTKIWNDSSDEPYVMVQGEIRNTIEYMRSMGIDLNEDDIVVDNGLRYYYSFEKFILAIYNDFM